MGKIWEAGIMNKYYISPCKNWKPSEEVAAIVDSIEVHRSSREYHSDWGRYHKKRLHSDLRHARLKQARQSGVHTDDEWRSMLEEFNYRCTQCGCQPDGKPTKDHILPIYLGGSDAISNIQPLCRSCNAAKGANIFNWAAYRRDNGFPDTPWPH
jgi:hypothetical protein